MVSTWEYAALLTVERKAKKQVPYSEATNSHGTGNKETTSSRHQNLENFSTPQALVCV